MRALVTGGGGFLGKNIVKALLAQGWQVRSFARGDYPELREMGAETVRGDLADAAAISAACVECDVVFHVAALVSLGTSRYEDFYNANVVGTENVIQACRNNAIQKLVFTSTPSVVFTGGDIAGADESMPYPPSFAGHYAKTKALAEQAVLAANGPELATVAIRPPLVWGPGDTSLMPRLVERAKAGRLVRIRGPQAMLDMVYIDNAVSAHLLAAEKLTPGSPVAGKAYFISNDDPRPTFDMIDEIIGVAGLPPVKRVVPRWVAETLAGVSETVYAITRPGQEAPLTRFMVRQMVTDRWFDISAAKNDFGYQPIVTMEEGLKRLREWYQSP